MCLPRWQYVYAAAEMWSNKRASMVARALAGCTASDVSFTNVMCLCIRSQTFPSFYVVWTLCNSEPILSGMEVLKLYNWFVFSLNCKCLELGRWICQVISLCCLGASCTLHAGQRQELEKWQSLGRNTIYLILILEHSIAKTNAKLSYQNH